MKKLRILVITFFCFSLPTFGCDFFPTVYKVPQSFSVQVKNDMGPVVGLKLRVIRIKMEEMDKLSPEELSAADSQQFVEVIAESVTDASGKAQFNLARTGGFILEAEHEAKHFDEVGLDVLGDAKPATVEMKWPSSAILQTKVLRGQLNDGLMSSHESPLGNKVVSVRTLVAYNEVASGKTNEDGSFAFENVPSGLYFLRIVLAEPSKAEPHGREGNIAIYVGDSSPRQALSISTVYSSCGLSYDLKENKGRYAPQACFQGGHQVPCKY